MIRVANARNDIKQIVVMVDKANGLVFGWRLDRLVLACALQGHSQLRRHCISCEGECAEGTQYCR